MIVLLIGLSAFDHAGWLGYRGNDWANYDQRSFDVTEVYSGDRIAIDNSGQVVPVQLMGVAAPAAGAPGADQAKRYTQARLKRRSVILRLESTQTRNANGDLLAYVYLSDSDDLNLDLIHDGKVFADRRFKHTLAGQFEQTETDARKKDRGMWNGLTFQQMPQWRQQWLAELQRERVASTQRSHK